MSRDSDAYAVVIENLKRQRDEIDRMIVWLEALASGKPISTTPASAPAAEGQDASPDEDDDGAIPSQAGEFLGMKVIDAAQIILRRHHKPMSPAAITSCLELGGLPVANSRTVASVLNRRRPHRV